MQRYGTTRQLEQSDQPKGNGNIWIMLFRLKTSGSITLCRGRAATSRGSRTGLIQEENSGRHGSSSTTCHRQAGAVTSKTSLISERQHIVKMDQNKTRNRIYWKPAIAATSQSLMRVGKEAIGSHIYNMCGVLMAKDIKELVIYIRDMTAEELVAFQDSEAATPISLPRYMENGTRSMKDFNGFAYQGEIYGTSRALQAVDVHSVGNNGGSRISAYWRPIHILGCRKECLILTNKVENAPSHVTQYTSIRNQTDERTNQ